MKNLILAIAAAFTFTAVSAQNLEVNTTASNLEWVGSKVGGKHNGTVDIKSGTLATKNGVVTGGEFLIDMTSIKCLDLTNAEYNGKLVGHLKSEDFFNVEKFNTAKLVITKVAKLKTPTKEANFQVTANLTIKGITQEIVFLALIQPNGKGMKATASFVVDRSKFDVRYGSKSFFENIGDKAISNDMEFTVNIVTK
jgi:polyisoprenoid-binding protein YceI